jgi:hypothetical protein
MGDVSTLSPRIMSGEKSVITNYKPSYQDLDFRNTNTILLIGHADNIELNNPVRIKSVQSAIDLLGADISSPLLRGVLNAYEGGARDIMIMASAPMSEYASRYEDRTAASNLFTINEATPSSMTFYERYYDRFIFASLRGRWNKNACNSSYGLR